MTDAVGTTEPAPLTHRRILKIAVPIVLSNATVPILGAVDLGVVGQMGEAAPIAAVGLGAIILSTVYWIFGFLRMGTVGLVGQAEGAGDKAEVSALLTRALLIAAAGGLGLILLQFPIIWLGLAISEASVQAEELTRQYIGIRIWSAPFAISVYALTGWLVAMERTGGVFWIQFIMNSLNIVLNLWFVLGLGWGVAGVAIATAISECVGAALGFWFCRSAFRNQAWHDWPRVFDRARLVRMAVVNTDILIRSLLLMMIFSSFVFAGSQFGDTILAANEILITFMYITAYAMDGFAFAAETLIARAYGRRDPMRVRKSAYMTAIWGLVVCVTMSVFFASTGPTLIDIMAKDEGVRATARVYLWWMAIAPLVGCAAWMLDGIFIGATRSRDMRNMMIVSAIVYFASLFALMPVLGNDGIWLALLIAFAMRGITLGLKYPALERSAVAS